MTDDPQASEPEMTFTTERVREVLISWGRDAVFPSASDVLEAVNWIASRRAVQPRNPADAINAFCEHLPQGSPERKLACDAMIAALNWQDSGRLPIAVQPRGEPPHEQLRSLTLANGRLTQSETRTMLLASDILQSLAAQSTTGTGEAASQTSGRQDQGARIPPLTVSTTVNSVASRTGALVQGAPVAEEMSPHPTGEAADVRAGGERADAVDACIWVLGPGASGCEAREALEALWDQAAPSTPSPAPPVAAGGVLGEWKPITMEEINETLLPMRGGLRGFYATDVLAACNTIAAARAAEPKRGAE